MKYKFTELRAMIDSTILYSISSSVCFFMHTPLFPLSFSLCEYLTEILTQYVTRGSGVHLLIYTDKTLLHGSSVCTMQLNL